MKKISYIIIALIILAIMVLMSFFKEYQAIPAGLLALFGVYLGMKNDGFFKSKKTK